MGIPFYEIVTEFELAREPGILNDGPAAAAIAASPVVGNTPLNGTRKSMMEPNEEDRVTGVEGLGTGTMGDKERDRQRSQAPVVQRVSEKSSVEDKLSVGATGIASTASTRRGENDEKELPSRPVTSGSIDGHRSSTPIANTGDATLNGHHHITERPTTTVVPTSVSADPGTHSASSSPLHLADHARRAAPRSEPWALGWP